MSIIHLHVHSTYTLLGATASIDDLVDRAVEADMSALALTDTNALYGAVGFHRACTQQGVQPLIGMALTVARQPEWNLPPGPPGLLVLLAQDPAGWRSLCRLSSAIQNHPDRLVRAEQGLTLQALRENAAGLLCIAGGRRGWFERLLRAGRPREAGRWLGKLAAAFGEENLYTALELHTPQDAAIAQEIVTISQRYGLPTVAVQPVYTLAPEDREELYLLAAMDQNTTLDALPADALPDMGDPRVDLHWLAPAEMAARFAAFPQALERMSEIPQRCRPCLPDGRPIWPVVQPAEMDSAAEGTPDARLAAQSEAGLAERFPRSLPEGAEERLQRELAAIARHGFAPLFLLVAEIVDFARRAEIPVSTRGSVANSLVAYCLGISDVDPLANNLLFERFLNPARTELPDIDLDFCSRRRDRVLAFVRERYGLERVALVATMNTFRPKSAVRETAKAHGLSEAEASRLTRRIRREWHPDPRRRQHTELEDLLAQDEDSLRRTILRRAWRIVDRPHHLSVHPGGLVVTPGPLTDYAPLQHAPKGFSIVQFDHTDAEALGLVKVDLLGIRALTVLADAAELVRRKDPAFRLAHIPQDDPRTGELLARGDTIGVFQCESTGAQRTLRQLRAQTPRDLAVANAFFKPGPATGGMAAAFVRRYRGEEDARYLHPALEPILGDTKGVLLFQEQVLRVATEIAGLTWAEAEHLRRGMSKFRTDEMERMRARFVAGCQRRGGPGLNEQQAAVLWEQVAAFAGYGFNQGHATAYASVSYRSAWLKAHYPAEFLCARLADRGGYHHPAVYMAEARRLGIRVHPPHVNVSGAAFTLRDDPQGHAPGSHLFMGLGQVRDLRRASVRAIVAERQARPFADLRDLVTRAPLQPKEVDHLIRCGALDGLASSRAALLAAWADMQRTGNPGQLAFDFGAEEVSAETPQQRAAWEQELLGLPVSVHPVELVQQPVGATPLRRLPEHRNRRVTVLGVRLPGWTGGKGFYLDDGDCYVVATLPEGASLPHVWQPVQITGCWRTDAWGGGWFEGQSTAT